jgi:hypothetical protein
MNDHRFRALRFALPLLVAALLVAGWLVPAAPGSASAERPIMAFYYPWYDMSDWSYDRMSDLPAPQYSGGDDETLERHIQQAEAAGIDAFICAWFGPNEERLDARCRRLMELAAESGSNLKIAIMPEQAAWEDLNNVDNLVQALGVLESDFMSQSNYLTFQGKPVVFWFNPPSLGGAATWQQVRERADPQRQQFWFGGTDQPQYLDVYDTLYFFDITWETAPGNAMASYASLLEGTGRPFAATVMPGYDDIAIRGGHRRDRENGAYYRGTWEDAVRYNADAVVITSFNEFAEGSHIEPSEQYGDFYLQLTREMVDYFHANVGQAGQEPPQPSPVGTPVVAPPEPGECRAFPETGFEVCGRLLQYWNENGGLPVFGYPISAQQELTIEGQPIQAQWFERNRLELHPENARPYDVLLGRLGVDVLEQQGRDWQAFPTAAEQAGCRYFAETGQNVCGDILAAWRSNGLELGDPGISEAESLALFGLPISPLQEEEIEGETYQVQWFERARFELHPENAPPNNVLLGLLGNEMREAGGME